MSKFKTMYLGQSGEYLVMSEFMLRGYNITVPEMDQGSDLLVLEEQNAKGTGKYWPIQIKTATSHKPARSEYGVGFNLWKNQFLTPVSPDLTYIFATRHKGKWMPLVIIPRAELQRLYENGSFGGHKSTGNHLMIKLRWQDGELYCNKHNFSKYIEDWSQWPKVEGLLGSGEGLKC